MLIKRQFDHNIKKICSRSITSPMLTMQVLNKIKIPSLKNQVLKTRHPNFNLENSSEEVFFSPTIGKAFNSIPFIMDQQKKFEVFCE